MTPGELKPAEPVRWEAGVGYVLRDDLERACEVNTGMIVHNRGKVLVREDSTGRLMFIPWGELQPVELLLLES